MLFASGIFLYAFLPLFLLGYALTPRAARSWFLTLASAVFYGWWRPDFLILMAVSIAVDYQAAAGIARAQARGGRGKAWLWLSLLTNLGLLAWFKYANFGVETLNDLLRGQGLQPIPWTRVVLPVGISFYTFQTMSYTLDVYAGRTRPVGRLADFACYVSMFPQLVAGPIVRYSTVAAELVGRRHSFDQFYRGVLSFQVGLAKKVLVADVLGHVADASFAADRLTTGDAWLGTVAYAFQIYFDFSGYSDMAIGLGWMLGFRFPVNFDAPYKSSSITEFWRRWHVSLSTFLRDYLYLPLGGNRRGPLRTYANLGLTMLLGGLWHGAAWTFVAWGAYQGAWLILERLLGKRAPYERAPRPVRVLATFLIVSGGWVLFRADSLGGAARTFASLAGFAPDAARSVPGLVGPLQVLVLALAAGIVWGTPTTQSLVARPRPAWALLVQPLFFLALVHMHFEEHVPFLYFQF